VTHLVYCAAGNRRFAEIAVSHGFRYGCRSDDTPARRAWFVDLDWKKPDLPRHLAFCAEHKPHLAVAPDVLSEGELPEALGWAERLAAHADRVLIVPKVAGLVERLPREPWLMIGYSVPTSYGGTDAVTSFDLIGWDCHLLGGNPQNQMRLAQYLRAYSADGNGFQKAARWGVYYDADSNTWVPRGPKVPHGPDLPYRAFEQSCIEIQIAWRRLRGEMSTDEREVGAGERLS
jgi:hypothetical protein